jgi:outer membrane biosynthesis protein TonB
MAVHASPQPRLSGEEKIGVVVAIALHVGLVAWLALAPSRSTFKPPPDRMTVSLSEEVAPEATSPEPLAQAAPETAPTLGEAAPAPEPLPEVVPPEPAPRVVASPLPRPAPPVARPVPRPVAKPAPGPAPSVPKPSAKPSAKPVTKTATPVDTRTRRRPDAPAGASRVGNDFLKGIPGGETRGAAQNQSAAKFSPQVAGSLRQAVARQLRPHWIPPQGADAELLRTTIQWALNADGSLSGAPVLVGQDGETDANRPQAKRHVEQAIRAIRLAAPFDLPDQYYANWKRMRFTFDRNLSQ